jgi:TusA-related sulfurtransferase
VAVSVDREVDARASFCPGPLLELIRMVRESETGATVAVLTTDPMALIDIPAWVDKAGHELVSEENHGRHHRFVVAKVR